MHMRVKARDDTNLKENEYVQDEVNKLEQCYFKFKARVDERLAEARAQDLEN